MKQILTGLKATNNRKTEKYFLLQLLTNHENVTQILNILYCYRVNILTQIFASGGGPWDNILSNVGWRPNTRNSLGR